MRTFLSLLAFAFGVSALFALLTFAFFPGQIKNAVSASDYIHYAVGTLTTSGTADMVPMSDGVQLWTSLYVLTVWVYVVYVAVNHISNVKIGRFG
jgi:ABC-type antimicrobial peptide transport system permease subunit